MEHTEHDHGDMQTAPTREQLAAYRAAGHVTPQTIRDEHARRSGHRCSLTAIGAAIVFAASRGAGNRFGGLSPLQVAEQHRSAPEYLFACLLSAQRRGKGLTDDELAQLDLWVKDLHATGRVVTYDPALGFRRAPSDGASDLIRRAPEAR